MKSEPPKRDMVPLLADIRDELQLTRLAITQAVRDLVIAREEAQQYVPRVRGRR